MKASQITTNSNLFQAPSKNLNKDTIFKKKSPPESHPGTVIQGRFPQDLQ